MKKTLIAVAALAATGAFAQVTVYGRLDVGYANTVNSSNIATFTPTTITTNAGVDTKASGVQSHNEWSSLWGIKGVEDLGGGMKASFQLEQDVYTANGNQGVSGAGGGAASAAIFDRVSRLNLEGGFGTVGFGRDYNPVFKLIGATDVNNLTRISTVSLAAATGGSTQPNNLFYTSPNMGGVTLNVALINDDRTAAAGDTYVKGTNATVVYSNGPLMVGGGFGSTETRVNGGGTQVSVQGVNMGGAGATALDKVIGSTVAGSYDFKVVKLVGNYITSKQQMLAASGVSDITQTELNLGVVVPLGKITLFGQLGTNAVKSDALPEDLKGNDYVIGLDYALSSRTSVFAKNGTYNKYTGNGVDFKNVSTAVGIKTTF